MEPAAHRHVELIDALSGVGVAVRDEADGPPGIVDPGDQRRLPKFAGRQFGTVHKDPEVPISRGHSAENLLRKGNINVPIAHEEVVVRLRLHLDPIPLGLHLLKMESRLKHEPMDLSRAPIQNNLHFRHRQRSPEVMIRLADDGLEHPRFIGTLIPRR